MEVIVWLKCYRKDIFPFKEGTIAHLNRWYDFFKDKNYKIYLYNENVNPVFLNKDNLEKSTVVNRKNIYDVGGGDMYKMLNSLKIRSNWMNVGSALLAPYYFLKNVGNNDDIIINLDSDDMWMYGDATGYIDKCIDLIKSGRTNCISYDLGLSKSLSNEEPNQWNFGVNLARKDKIFEMLEKFNNLKYPEAPWGTNIDYVFQKYFEQSDDEIISFITKEGLLSFLHHKVKFNEITNKVEIYVHNKLKFEDKKHTKTITL